MSHIKFAGITSNWDYVFAKAYAEKLFEMGFHAKAIRLDESRVCIVAYSHRSFSCDQWQKAFRKIVSKT